MENAFSGQGDVDNLRKIHTKNRHEQPHAGAADIKIFHGRFTHNCAGINRISSVSDGSDVEGCMDDSACNYNADATVDDGSCLELDCANECGRSAVVDECGVCGGAGIADGACDCDGNIEDCAGECGGSAAIDECGVCDGSGIADGACD